MRHVHSVAQVRAAEAELMQTGPDGSLMQRAAYGLAMHCRRLLRERRGSAYGARVTLLVGSGGNGGDALWAGVFLRSGGVQVRAVLATPEKAWPAGLAAFGTAWVVADAPRAEAWVREADLVVDGLVGLGARGGIELPEPVFDAAAAAGLVVAVDVPSGVGVDTGQVFDRAIRADCTVTFGALKPAHVLAPARSVCGEVVLVDIGLDPGAPVLRVLEADDVEARWPVQAYEGSKYTLGVVGVLAGSDRYPGAGVLATGGALRGKSGMVRYVGTGDHVDLIRSRWPEVVVSPRITDAGRVQAWVAGPGLGTDDGARAAVAELLERPEPLLLDADALTILADDLSPLERRTATTVLTPHAGEFVRMFGEIGDDPVARVLEVAERYGAVVLLKGATTIVASPAGRVWVNPTGTPDLGAAGTGDVLSGLAGALLAASEVTGLPADEAVACAAYVHGVAGASARRPVIATDVVAALPRVLDVLLRR